MDIRSIIAQTVGDSEESLQNRTEIMEVFKFSPIISLELSRILQGIKHALKTTNQERLICPLIHGDKVTIDNIKIVMMKFLPEYTMQITKKLGVDAKYRNWPINVVCAAGSEEELSQLGEVTITHLILEKNRVH